jgi:hypothetical protein
MPPTDDYTNPKEGHKCYNKVQLAKYYSRIIKEM